MTKGRCIDVIGDVSLKCAERDLASREWNYFIENVGYGSRQVLEYQINRIAQPQARHIECIFGPGPALIRILRCLFTWQLLFYR